MQDSDCCLNSFCKRGKTNKVDILVGMGKIKRNITQIAYFLREYLEPARIFIQDHVYLVFKSSAENHLRIQHCKIHPEAGEVCHLTFDSYSDLKKYQKKIRIFTYSFSSTVVSISLAVVALNLFLPSSQTQGATYTWFQTGWLSAPTANSTSHPDGENEFTDYVSKDANIAIANPASVSPSSDDSSVTLSAVNATKSQTDDSTAETGFNMPGNNKQNTVVSGTGNSASVALGQNNVYGTGITSDDTNTVTTLAQQGGWAAGTFSGTVQNGQIGNNASVKLDATAQTNPYLGVFANGVPVDFYAEHPGIAIDSVGNIYAIVQSGVLANNVIKKYNSSGTLVTTIGTSGNAYYGIAVDNSTGSIYVTDSTNIRKYTSNNGVNGTVYSGGSIFVTPGGAGVTFRIATDQAGNVYASVKGTGIKKYNSSGSFVVQVVSGNFNGLFIDSSGNVFAASTNYMGDVYKYTPQSGGGVNATSYFDPQIPMFKIQTVVAESALAGNTYFDEGVGAIGISFDSQGNLYVSAVGYICTGSDDLGCYMRDSYPGFIKIKQDGTLLTYHMQIAGTGNEQFKSASNVVMDSSENIYIGDTTAPGHIKKFGASAYSYPIAGTQTYTGYVDSGNAAYVWQNFAWDGTFPNSQTNISFKVVGSTTTTKPTDPAFSASQCSISTTNSDGSYAFSGGCATALSGKRYLWYQATLSTADASNTPLLDSISATALISTVYYNTGTFTSGVIDVGRDVSGWGNVSWNETLNGQTITVKARSCNDSVCAGEDSNKNFDSNCGNLSNGSALTNGGCVSAGDRYIQYRATLNSNTLQTPSLNDVTLGYAYYPTDQTLVSSAYDSGSDENVMGSIAWTEDQTLPDGTDIILSVRTASSQNNLTGSWFDINHNDCVKDGSSGVVTCSNLILPAGMRATTGNRWFQYKITFTSTGAQAPTVHDVAIKYVINAPPEFQNVVAMQKADGKVEIDFEARDPDTVTQTIATKLQYCSDHSGVCMDPSDWIDAVSVSGDNGDVGVETVQFNAYKMVWDAKTDFDDHYIGNMRVRIKGDDAENANRYGYGVSSLFVLDTKNPANVTASINHVANEITIVKDGEIDDSPYAMYVATSQSALDSADAILSSETNPQYPFQFAFDALSNMTDPATVWIRIKDANGNVTDISETTPKMPSYVQYYDVSKVDDELFQELITWEDMTDKIAPDLFGSYDIYRAVITEVQYQANQRPSDQDYVLVQSISSSHTNYYFDTNLESDKHYFYKIVMKDAKGSTSLFTAIKDDIPNGTGGSNTGLPTISNAQVTNKNTTSLKVTWATENIADSMVEYSNDEEFGEPNDPQAVIVPSYTKNHSIVLTQLTPNTRYFIRLTSKNPDNITDTTMLIDESIKTANGPEISGVTVTEISNKQATIYWKTDVPATSSVVYSDAISNGTLVSPVEEETNEGETTHKKTITFPEIGKRYYFYVISEDIADAAKVALDNNGENFYELLLTDDQRNPEIVSDPEIAEKTDRSALISWVTNEPANTNISFRKKGAGSFADVPVSLQYDRNHFALLSGLEPDTAYEFKVKSVNINEKEIQSSVFEFRTDKSPDQNHDPLSDITFHEKTPEILTDTAAVIALTTDQVANCFVEYGTESGNYTYTPVKERENVFNRNHTITLTGLLFNTKHFFKVTCKDNLGEPTVVSSDEKEFTTLEKLYTESDLGADRVPAAISNVKVAAVTGESVRITWETNEKSNSFVKYGIDSSYGNLAGDPTVNFDQQKYAMDHSITINGLIPATRYVFKVGSSDASGNIAESGEYEFTTESPSSLSSINVVSTSLGQATITWKTDKKTSSIVEYGLSTSYGEKKEKAELQNEHSISVFNLNQGETYHFRVKGKGEDNILYSSGDYTFEPKSPPQIDDVAINDITEHDAVISFITNVPTRARVEYVDVKDKTENGSRSDDELKREHSIHLKDLKQGTTFAVKIRALDDQGSENEIVANDFTTGKDENPPKIDQVRTDVALTQSDKVQAIINWKTDEQADTYLVYKEGRNGSEKEIKISESLSNTHVAVITTFKPGTVYYFKVKSTDASKNTATSNDFALLTPKRRENIIQIIINNFQQIFRWAQ